MFKKGMLGWTLCSVFFIASNVASNKTSEKIYTAGKEWVYVAHFYDLSGSIIRTDTVILKISKESNIYRAIWMLKQDNFVDTQRTEVIETEFNVSLVPPRFDEYLAFTDYLAYPHFVKSAFASAENIEWTGFVVFDEQDMQGISKQKIKLVKIDTVSVVPLIREATIQVTTYSDSLPYMSIFKFREDQGFSYMEYHNPDGRKLVIRLAAVK